MFTRAAKILAQQDLHDMIGRRSVEQSNVALVITPPSIRHRCRAKSVIVPSKSMFFAVDRLQLQ